MSTPSTINPFHITFLSNIPAFISTKSSSNSMKYINKQPCFKLEFKYLIESTSIDLSTIKVVPKLCIANFKALEAGLRQGMVTK